MIDGGAIINVASQVPLRGGTGVASYAAAKAGVIGLTRALARELGPRIRVAAIAPGPVESPMTAKHAADPEWVAARVGTLIERRFALPEEVAPSVVFLAAASGTLFHGQTLHVNGGGALQ
jgi:3-oxoacyl-[acyl-carrier protein] reductase